MNNINEFNFSEREKSKAPPPCVVRYNTEVHHKLSTRKAEIEGNALFSLFDKRSFCHRASTVKCGLFGWETRLSLFVRCL